MTEQWSVRPYPNLVDEFEVVSGDGADYEHIADTRGEAAAYLIASAPLLKSALIQALEEGATDHPGRCGQSWCWIDQAHAALKASVPPTAAAGASADAGGQAT